MRILLLNMYYLREGDAGMRRFKEFARIWNNEYAAEVTVVAGQLHYNTGEIYPDLRGKPVSEESDGDIRVLRVAAPDTYHKGFAGKAWSQINWAYNIRRLLPQLSKPEIVIASSPPLWVSLPMVTAQRRWHVPTIFEVRDIWPEAVVRMNIAPSYHLGVLYLGSLERWSNRKADHVVTIVESQRQNLSQRGIKPASEISVITNGVVLEKYNSVPPGTREEVRKKLGVDQGTRLVMNVGSHGLLYDLINLVKLAEKLKRRKDIHFVSAGGGVQLEMLRNETSARGLENLSFIGPVPTDEVPRLLTGADIAVSLVMHDSSTGWNAETSGTFRNALFDYAGARLPVVFNDPGFVEREIADRAKAGIYVSLENGVDEMAQRIEYLADSPRKAREMGANNYEHIAVKFNRSKMARKYYHLMQDLVAKGETGTRPQ